MHRPLQVCSVCVCQIIENAPSLDAWMLRPAHCMLASKICPAKAAQHTDGHLALKFYLTTLIQVQAQGVALFELQAEKLEADGNKFSYSFFNMLDGSLNRLPDNSFAKGNIALITPADDMPGELLSYGGLIG